MKKLFIFLVLIPLISFAQCWQSVDAGANHTLAIKNDGTLWSWGSNNFYKLGYETPSGTNPNPNMVGNATNWQSVSAGEWHSAGIKSDGTLWVWGYNKYGQGGQGTSGTENAIIDVPTQIGSDNNWLSVSAGTNYTLAVKNDGTLWGTGNNEYGELGIGTSISAVFMTQIGTDTNWNQVSAGGSDSLALKLDGTLWTWGTGYLGNGNEITTSNIPIQLGVENDWLKISKETGSAIKINGTLWSWGFHSGNGTIEISTIPTQIGSSANWKCISTGIGIKTDGTLWTWGLDEYGQLGDSTSINNFLTSQVGNDTDWESISDGGYYYYNVAIKTNSTLFSWGLNSSGELGNGTTIDSSIPTQVDCTKLKTIDFENDSFTIFPNPAKDFINIKKSDNLLIDKITVIDIYGKTVIIAENLYDKLNIQHLPNGIYLLQINCQNRKFNYKFIKE